MDDKLIKFNVGVDDIEALISQFTQSPLDEKDKMSSIMFRGSCKIDNNNADVGIYFEKIFGKWKLAFYIKKRLL